MATNPTPTNDAVLLARCHDMLRGLQSLEEEIGVKQHTAAKLLADLEAVSAALLEVGRVKQLRSQRRAALRQADKAGRKRISCCRLRLVPLLGYAFNAGWDAAGFPDRSTQVPESQAVRLTLLRQLGSYFTLKPEHASEDMGATAAACLADYEALSDGRSGVNRIKSQLRTAVSAKNAALKALRRRMRGVIDELGLLLTDDDARWLRFGLNLPARPTAPEAVSSVTLTAHGERSVLAEWPRARRARRYRVQIRLPGAAEFVHALTVRGRQALLRRLPPGQVVEVRVIAANSAAEAAPSPAASVTVL